MSETNNKLKIMFLANAPWCRTGYGVQGYYLTRGWAKRGHDVSYCAYYGLRGGVLSEKIGERADGSPIMMRIYPPAYDPWANDIIGSHCEREGSNVLITLMDVWVQQYFGTLPLAWCPWMPIDHDPVPPLVLNKLWGARRILAYAKFGVEKLAEAGLQAEYIPHGVDTQVFTPGAKAEARKRLGLPQEAFLVAMVAANKGFPSRKAFPEQLSAFARFRATHPDAYLYLHTVPTDVEGGIQFDQLIGALGMDDKCTAFCDQYAYATGLFPPDYMADVYRAADVLLAASQSEGFGVPILEAQACGCPVITSRFSSMTELTWYGISVDPIQAWWTPMASWSSNPSIEGLVAALEEVYTHAREDRPERTAAVERAKTYDWQTLLDNHWEPFLASLAAEIRGDIPPKLPWPEQKEWQDKTMAPEPRPRPTWGHAAAHSRGVKPENQV